MTGIFLICILLVGAMLLLKKISNNAANKRNQLLKAPFNPAWEKILNEKIAYYRSLSEQEKIRFQNKVKIFLSSTKISGVKDVQADDSIKLLVAASAVIPIFLFDEWEYVNLSEVLIYDGPVITNQASDTEVDGTVLGQVRPFQNKHLLLLSKQSLENGFKNLNDKQNVGFHEFAHLIDEADGTIDGIPKIIMPDELIIPWTKLMYEESKKIQARKSDINPYALTNHAEFFAVVSEYFFENPEKFKKNHQDLYLLLSKVFTRK